MRAQGRQKRAPAPVKNFFSDPATKSDRLKVDINIITTITAAGTATTTTTATAGTATTTTVTTTTTASAAAIELLLGGSGPYTSTDKTNKNNVKVQ